MRQGPHKPGPDLAAVASVADAIGDPVGPHPSKRRELLEGCSHSKDGSSSHDSEIAPWTSRVTLFGAAREKSFGDILSRWVTLTDVDEVEVVVAHQERATLRVGALFLKIDADQQRTDVEVEAMTMAPIPVPEVLWRKPPVLALAALPGRALGRLGEASTASPAAWTAAGEAIRMLHDAPLPPWPGASLDEKAASLDSECTWLLANDVLPADLVTRNRRVAEAALRPWTPVFMHGDLQADHVFVDGDRITGVLDWSEAGRGDAMYDLASLTLGHPEHLRDVLAGYGPDVEPDVIRAWWSWRSLTAIRWLVEHGFDPSSPGCEVDVLRSQV